MLPLNLSLKATGELGLLSTSSPILLAWCPVNKHYFSPPQPTVSRLALLCDSKFSSVTTGNPACVPVKESKLIMIILHWIASFCAMLGTRALREISQISNRLGEVILAADQVSPTTPWLLKPCNILNSDVNYQFQHSHLPKWKYEMLFNWQRKIQVPFKRTMIMQNNMRAGILKQLAKNKDQPLMETHNHLVSCGLQSRYQELRERINPKFLSDSSPTLF